MTLDEEDLVLKAIGIMTNELQDRITLGEIAERTSLGKYAVIRAFNRVTGTSPHTFLAALRIDHAKRLLICGNESVTDVAARVGYESLGTFSHTFHRLVGYSPSDFVLATEQYGSERFFSDSLDYARRERDRAGALVKGRLSAPSGTPSGLFFVGAFDRAVPRGKPLAGCILLGPGRFRFLRPQAKRFRVLALWLPFSVHPFFPARDDILGASVRVEPDLGAVAEDLQDVEIALRPLAKTDPPLVIALPSLLAT